MAGISVDIGAYEYAPVGSITGSHDICVGYTLSLGDTTTGGLWMSTNSSIATVSTAGVVTGVASGTDTVMYIVVGSCITDTVSTVFMVLPSADAGVIIGNPAVCAGAATTLTDSVTGGAWTLSNSHAGFSGGVVTGISAGIDTITYTNSCGISHVSVSVTVHPVPVLAPIAGSDTMCISTSVVLSDSATGGFWRSDNGNILVSGDTATAAMMGTTTIVYTDSTIWGCMDSVLATYTVQIPPFTGAIFGTTEICAGTPDALTETITGGVWSSDYTAIATVDSAGTVTGLSEGIDFIKYTVTNVCGSRADSLQIAVSQLPTPIAGIDTFCTGSPVLFTDSIPDGTWNISDITTATINDTGLVVGIMQGADVVQYTVTNTCGTNTVSGMVYVEQPATAITGGDTVCYATASILYDSTFGGIWTSSNTDVATIDSALGAVIGMAIGTVTITYTVHNVCGLSHVTETLHILRTSLCDSLDQVKNTSSQTTINIYPNPTNGSVHIDAPMAINVSLQEMEGKLIKYIPDATDIDLTDLPDGIFMIVIYDEFGKKLSTQKIIKD